MSLYDDPRMAQTTQWLQAVQSCISEGLVSISTVYGQFSCSNS
jgi:hypothetical protein